MRTQTLIKLGCACLLGAGYLQAASISNPSFENGIPVGAESLPFLGDTAPAGWTVWNRIDNATSITTSSPDWIHGERSGMPGASNGDYFVGLDSYSLSDPEAGNIYAEGGIRSTVSGLTIGQTYEITLDACQFILPNAMIWDTAGFLDGYAGSAGSSSLSLMGSVSVTDKIVYNSGGGLVSSAIGSYTFSFQATAESMEIGFRSRIDDPLVANQGRGYSMGIDNLQIQAVPEPSSLLLVASATTLGLVRRRRQG